MSQQNIQSHGNPNQNSIPSDRMTNYLQDQRPSVIMGNDNEPIIIPPLNTDIRFNAYPLRGPPEGYREGYSDPALRGSRQQQSDHNNRRGCKK